MLVCIMPKNLSSKIFFYKISVQNLVRFGRQVKNPTNIWKMTVFYVYIFEYQRSLSLVKFLRRGKEENIFCNNATRELEKDN